MSGGDGRRVTPAELEALGLYDPAAEHAAQRLELIEYLLSLGATVEEMREAGSELPGLASELLLRGGHERLTLAEAAGRAGVDIESAARLWRAAGLPDPEPDARPCSEADVDVLRTFAAGRQLLGEEVVLQIVRVAAAAMARVAEAAISAMLVHVGAPSLARDPSGLALARANAEAAALVPGLAHALDVVLRHHLEVGRRPIEALAGTLRGYESQRLTVGFVDLVGSTKLTQRLSTRELGAALDDFEACVADTLTAAGGRLVKLIGDEAMFVVSDPATACAVALDLISAFSGHPVLPPARGGLAIGEVLTREGDYFGATVNLAARAVDVAAANTVVVTTEVQLEARGYQFLSTGAHSLRGFDRPVELFRLEAGPGS